MKADQFIDKMYNCGLRKIDFTAKFGKVKCIRKFYLEHSEECEQWLKEKEDEFHAYMQILRNR